MGSLTNVHTVRGPVTSPLDLDDGDPVLQQLLFHELLDRGVYLAARGYLALSAAVTGTDCDRVVDTLGDALAAIEATERATR